MGDVLMLGGGICGLATAMLLARDGHTVRVLERDRRRSPARSRMPGKPGIGAVSPSSGRPTICTPV